MERIKKAFINSINGLKITFHDEAAFRQELVICIVLTPVAFYLAPGRLELAVMLLALFVVLIAETLNTGIEAVTNKASPEMNHFAKKAKDAGSAAVFISLVAVATVWGVILL